MKPNWHFNLLAIFALAIVSGCSSATSTGQRFLHFQVKENDKLVFETKTGVPDDTPVEKMWDAIEKATFEVSKEYAESIEANATSHQLKGPVVIEISHVGKKLTSSTIDTLQLKKDENNDWVIDESELDLIKQSAVKSK